MAASIVSFGAVTDVNNLVTDNLRPANYVSIVLVACAIAVRRKTHEYYSNS